MSHWDGHSPLFLLAVRKFGTTFDQDKLIDKPKNMATQHGLIKIKGTLDGVTFYKRDGMYIVRMAGGANKNKLLNDPAYKRTRENMREFGGSSVTGKSFRSIFSKVSYRFRDPNYVGRVTAMMKKVNLASSGQRGKRHFEILSNKAQMLGFEFNRSTTLNAILRIHLPLPEINADRNFISWNVPDFDTESQVSPPDGATHFRLILVAGCLSNHVYDASVGKYVAAYPEENGKSVTSMSPAIPLHGMVGSDLTFSADLGLDQPLPPGVAVLVAIGVLFYQKTAADLVEFAGSNVMRLVLIA